MSWAIGYDDDWKRDIGYGVPAYCDHPGCKAEIDRGLSYVCCGSEPYGGENGCGRFFCSEHHEQSWTMDDEEICGHEDIPSDHISPDHTKWIKHKLTDESWQQWRDENSNWVDEHYELVKR